MSETFDKPLDTDLVEEQEIEYQTLVPDGQNPDGSPRFRLDKVKEKVHVKTRYTKAEPKFFSCKDGHHYWQMVDRYRHIAKCANCAKHRFLRAVYETIDKDGHIVDRETGIVID